ncbi:MAG: hypothetical protein AB8G23_16230 [Myxococcota bacterium]
MLMRSDLRLPIRALLLVVLAALLGSLGCANGEFRPGDPFDREVTLSEAQHQYTIFVRWSEFQRAGTYVDPDDRDAFLERMDQLEEARFTDYESGEVELDEELETATIEVKYMVYTPSSPYELEISEIQEWSRSGVSNKWQVKSTFEGLQQLALN